MLNPEKVVQRGGRGGVANQPTASGLAWADGLNLSGAFLRFVWPHLISSQADDRTSALALA